MRHRGTSCAAQGVDRMALRVLIADDEQLARNELCFQLEQLDHVEIVGQAGDGPQAVSLAETLEPDLVLLDIQMPGLTGFEVARQLLDRGVSSHVVFVTAFDQYAMDAFEVHAVDYLLKPVEPPRLVRTIERIRRLVTTSDPSHRAEVNQELERIVEYVAERQSRRERVAVKIGDRLLLVQADDIVCVSLADDVITIVTDTVTGTSNYRTLDELHSHLDPSVFWRVHRSHLVNINKIKEIVPWFSRNYILRMKDEKGTEIPVSRAQTKRFREYLSL
jgi:two-component system response regulator LytT